MSDLFFRNIPIGRKIDVEKRQIELPFSSEYPVERYFGSEILLHGEENVDLSYLESVGSVLQRHGGEVTDIIGPIIKSWIQDRTGRAIVGFDDDDIGNRAMAKVQSGSLRGVSFGYRIEKGIRLDEPEDVWVDPVTKVEYRGPGVIGTRWRAHEITFTPVPADHTVGLRSLVDQICFENMIRKMEDSRMDEKDKKEIAEMIRSALAEVKIPSLEDIRGMIEEERTPKIQVKREELIDLSNRASAVSDKCKCAILDMATEGRSHVEMLTFINDEAMKTRSGDATHRQSAGNGQHDAANAHETYRTIDEIPDHLFVSAFGGGR